MATLAPDSDSDSDYGFDLTPEQEELFANLVAGASSQAPQLASGIATPSRTSNAGSSLKADINAAFAAHASVKSLSYDELDYDTAEHVRGFTYNNPAGLAPLAKGKGRLSPSAANNRTPIAPLVDKSKPRSIPTHFEDDDISYPDLSSALAEVLDTSATDLKPESERQPTLDGETRSPLARFRSFPKKPFSVSDLTAGAWCEMQYYYTLTKLPGGKKTRTAAMKGGTKLHKQLEEQVYTTVKIDIAKKEDAFALKLWNVIQGLRTLRDTGMTREMETWGLVDGEVVNGVIDGLSYENPDPDFEEEVRSSQGNQNSQPAKEQPKITGFFGSTKEKEKEKVDDRQIFLFDVKTRASNTLPSGAVVRPTKIQLFLYHRFLANMASGKLNFLRIFARYGLGPDEPLSDSFMAQIGALHDEIFDDDDDDAPSDYVSAPSTPPPGNPGPTAGPTSSQRLPPPPPPDLIHYRTLRELLPLLQSELRLTFPRGAASLGALVTVEYRRRATPAEEEDSGGGGGGEVIGENVFYVDDEVLDRYLAEDMQWWRAAREPRGVVIEEAYKCRGCEFAGECGWRVGQEAELLRRSKARRGGRKV